MSPTHGTHFYFGPFWPQTLFVLSNEVQLGKYDTWNGLGSISGHYRGPFPFLPSKPNCFGAPVPTEWCHGGHRLHRSPLLVVPPTIFPTTPPLIPCMTYLCLLFIFQMVQMQDASCVLCSNPNYQHHSPDATWIGLNQPPKNRVLLL